MEESLNSVIEHGALGLFEYGVLGIFAGVGLTFLLWSSYQCSKTTKDAIDNNTKALHSIELVMAEIKAHISRGK